MSSAQCAHRLLLHAQTYFHCHIFSLLMSVLHTRTCTQTIIALLHIFVHIFVHIYVHANHYYSYKHNFTNLSVTYSQYDECPTFMCTNHYGTYKYTFQDRIHHICRSYFHINEDPMVCDAQCA